MFKKIIPLIILCFFISTSINAQEQQEGYSIDERIYTTAEITAIKIIELKRNQGIKLTETRIEMKVLEGEHRDEIKTAVFGGESDLPEDMRYKTGDRVFIGISKNHEEGSTGYISLYDIDNSPFIIILIGLMILFIIIIGKWKGVASLLALTLTIVLIFLILIPATLKGFPPLPITLGLAVISVIVTLPLIAGFRLKTLAAVLGATGGILLSGGLAILFGMIMHLSGIVTNDMLTIFYTSDVNIDLRGLVLSGMIIAALGAIMDICISIASSTAEIFNANPEISEKKAFTSVLNIGTDILGSMVNTLILAYVGSSMSMILYIAMRIKPEMPFWLILNYNPVLSEIVKSAIGSIGMFISIPLTAIISVKLYRKFMDKNIQN